MYSVSLSLPHKTQCQDKSWRVSKRTIEAQIRVPESLIMLLLIQFTTHVFCLVYNTSPFLFPLEPSLSIGACVSRAGFRSTRLRFRVSRALVKRAQWSQENKHFHA